MTISSYPWPKLLLAIIAAIAVGIIANSVSWGIATFFILMFIFIFLASWIFGGISGSSIGSNVEVNDELEELLNTLLEIGKTKRDLPFNARSWLNSAGLYVQIGGDTGGLLRLRAGYKHHSQIDAWRDNSSLDFALTADGVYRDWIVKEYKRGDWEKLVNPTYAIANWLTTYGGFPEEYKDDFKKALELFSKGGHLELPPTGKESPIFRPPRIKRFQ